MRTLLRPNILVFTTKKILESLNQYSISEWTLDFAHTRNPLCLLTHKSCMLAFHYISVWIYFMTLLINYYLNNFIKFLALIILFFFMYKVYWLFLNFLVVSLNLLDKQIICLSLNVLNDSLKAVSWFYCFSLLGFIFGLMFWLFLNSIYILQIKYAIYYNKISFLQ